MINARSEAGRPAAVREKRAEEEEKKNASAEGILGKGMAQRRRRRENSKSHRYLLGIVARQKLGKYEKSKISNGGKKRRVSPNYAIGKLTSIVDNRRRCRQAFIPEKRPKAFGEERISL
jgi:hypothetical protein